MKTKLFLSLVVAITFGLILSCASAPQETAPAIEMGSLAGTKWSGNKALFGTGESLEFVDETNCIFTTLHTPYTLTYTVTGNVITLSQFNLSYELKGNKLYHDKTPMYTKE